MQSFNGGAIAAAAQQELPHLFNDPHVPGNFHAPSFKAFAKDICLSDGVDGLANKEPNLIKANLIKIDVCNVRESWV